MKIMIIRNSYSYNFGGAERLAVNIANEVILNGYSALVISAQQKLIQYSKNENVPSIKGVWWSKQSWNGWQIVLTPLYFAWQLFLYFWYIIKIIKYRPDALHILSKDDFIAATLAAKLLRKKIIWTDCADLKHIYKNHGIWYKNPIGKVIYVISKYVDKVSLVSNSERLLIEDALNHNVPDNYEVIHIAGKRHYHSSVDRDSDDEDAVIFCATSRMVTDKGIKELIEAFNKLQTDHSNVRLWLLGDGPEIEDFKEIATPGVKFFGLVNNPLDYVTSTDVFVHPTYHEGFSLSLAEAAMLGKPMIATNVGGNPELVNDSNGLLVPIKDTESLYEAMLKLYEDKNLRLKLGTQAKNDYDEYFDFSTIIKKKFIPLYA